MCLSPRPQRGDLLRRRHRPEWWCRRITYRSFAAIRSKVKPEGQRTTQAPQSFNGRFPAAITADLKLTSTSNASTFSTSARKSIRSRPSKSASASRFNQSVAEAQSLALASSGSTSIAFGPKLSSSRPTSTDHSRIQNLHTRSFGYQLEVAECRSVKSFLCRQPDLIRKPSFGRACDLSFMSLAARREVPEWFDRD
jgi:hypothetical protein